MEIKFRGLRRDGHSFYYGDLISYGSYLSIRDKETQIEFSVIPESVGQFSGEKDKEGNDIYNNDRIVFDDEFETVIEFKNGAFGYEGNYGFYTLHETNLGMLKIKN